MTVKQSEQYQLVIRSLSDRIVEAQAPIRILDAIKWDDSLREEFFRKRCKSIGRCCRISSAISPASSAPSIR